MSKDFRPKGYNTIKANIDKISSTQLFITGTLPVALESVLINTLNIDRELVQAVRNDTTPRNIRFEWRATSSIYTLTNELCRQLNPALRQKAIIYIDSIDNGTELKATYGWPFYHARDRNTRQRGEMFAA